MSKYTTEERNARWAKGEYVSLEGKPLTGIFLERARRHHWNSVYAERALGRAELEGHWLSGDFIDKWQQPLTGSARTAAERRVRAIRRQQLAWRLANARSAEES